MECSLVLSGIKARQCKGIPKCIHFVKTDNELSAFSLIHAFSRPSQPEDTVLCPEWDHHVAIIQSSAEHVLHGVMIKEENVSVRGIIYSQISSDARRR